MRYYYHGTIQARWEAIQSAGRLKAPVFMFDDDELASLFAERTAEIEDDVPVVLRLDLKGFRVYEDPTAPFIEVAHTTRRDVPIELIEEVA